MSSDDVNKGKRRFPAATSDSFLAADTLMIGVSQQGAV